MLWYNPRMNSIHNKEQLFKTLETIHFDCFQLCKKYFNRYFPVTGNIGVFCHSEDEYIFLTKLRTEMTYPSDNPDQKYFLLKNPIIMEQANSVPKTTYTHLYVRQPDPTPFGNHSGDVDFCLPTNEYNSLIQSVKNGGYPHGVAVYTQKGLELVELSDPTISALAYISTEEIAEKMRYR